MRIAKDEPKEIRKFLLEHEPDEGEPPEEGWKSRWFDYALELQLFSIQRNLGTLRFECPTDNLFVQARHLLLLRRWTGIKEHRSLRGVSAPQPESYPLDPDLRRALSNLCSFEGIGEKGARNLLFKFRSLKNLYRALIEEDKKSLREVEGIGKVLSDRMIQLLGKEFENE